MKYVESNVVVDLEAIGEKIKNILRENVKKLWYERNYTPTHYTRTFELIDSITVSQARKINKGYEVVIYFDPDKINPYPAENGEWSKHESITTGTNIAPYLPLWIEEGQNSPLFSYEGVHPVKTTKEYLRQNQYIIREMAKLLEAKGFKVIIK